MNSFVWAVQDSDIARAVKRKPAAILSFPWKTGAGSESYDVPVPVFP